MEMFTQKKYYQRTSTGGWSPCIQGNKDRVKIVKEYDTLCNCFSGDTKIITRDGVKELKDLVDKEVEVLSREGVYRKAIGHCYGKQELYELSFSNGDKVLTTLNHRWLVIKKSQWLNKSYQKEQFIETKDLKFSKSYNIPYNKIYNISIDRDGIINGCIYGDGTLYNEKKYSCMALCGEKKEYLKEYFINSKHSCIDSNGTIRHYPYSKELKSIPGLDKPLEYLKGFICGLIATDGCVGNSEVKISTMKEEDAYKISEICKVLGYQTKIRIERNHKSNFDDKLRDLYYIIPYIREEEMFLNPKHKQKVKLMRTINRTYTHPTGIKYIGMDDVYCVEEPETHTITLEDMILTGQCVGWSVGRFNEFSNQNGCKYLKSKDPCLMLNAIKDQGLETGTEPRVGAAIIWTEEGNHGHIESVEYVNKEHTEFDASASGYNSNSYYWTCHHSKDNGNWVKGESWMEKRPYKFQAFIYQPLIKVMYVNAELGLNLRQKRTVNSAVVGFYPYKSKVNIYAMDGEWYATEYGFVNANYLQDEPVVETPTQEAIEQSVEVVEKIIEAKEEEIPSYYDKQELNNALLWLIEQGRLMIEKSSRKDEIMAKIKTVSKYIVNILTILNALLLAINSVDGITIPYCTQISGVMIGVCSVISTYLLGQKVVSKE